MGLRELDPAAGCSTTAPRPCGCETRDPAEALALLHARDRQHVFLEGGPHLAAAFLRAGLVDEVVAYVAPALLGAGTSAVGRPGHHHDRRRARLRITDVTTVGDAAPRPTCGSPCGSTPPRASHPTERD